VDPTETVQKAIDKMLQSKVGSIMVMSQRQAVGIFTERDVVDKVFRGKLNTQTTKIEEVMSQNVITGSLEMSVRDAMHLLASNRIRHLPIASFVGDAIDEGKVVVF
jgi:CBS domain-containing protein